MVLYIKIYESTVLFFGGLKTTKKPYFSMLLRNIEKYAKKGFLMLKKGFIEKNVKKLYQNSPNHKFVLI